MSSKNGRIRVNAETTRRQRAGTTTIELEPWDPRLLYDRDDSYSSHSSEYQDAREGVCKADQRKGKRQLGQQIDMPLILDGEGQIRTGVTRDKDKGLDAKSGAKEGLRGRAKGARLRVQVLIPWPTWKHSWVWHPTLGLAGQKRKWCESEDKREDKEPTRLGGIN